MYVLMCDTYDLCDSACYYMGIVILIVHARVREMTTHMKKKLCDSACYYMVIVILIVHARVREMTTHMRYVTVRDTT